MCPKDILDLTLLHSEENFAKALQQSAILEEHRSNDVGFARYWTAPADLHPIEAKASGADPQTVAVPLVILMKHNGHWLRELSGHWRCDCWRALNKGRLKSTPLSNGRRASSVAGFAPDVPYVSLWWNFYMCTAIHGSSKKNTHIQKNRKGKKKKHGSI